MKELFKFLAKFKFIYGVQTIIRLNNYYILFKNSVIQQVFISEAAVLICLSI